MAQTLTDIKSNFIYSDDKAKVTEESLNNGDVAFCAEDKSITLKYNDSLYNMGGKEVADASDAVKGITKLSDAIDRDDSTVAATSKAIKTTYDEAINAKTKANEAYAMGESLTSRVEVIENAIAYSGSIIGIACTGEYTMEGATLAWIDNNFNEVTMLKKNYFNNHPSYKFEETLFGSDQMIKIPLCYWWRGTIPSGPFQGKWGMLLSPTANPGISGLTFKPNYVAFMNKGTLKDCFYIGKYTARNVSNVPVSQYDGNAYVGVTFTEARTLCANKGADYHMFCAQEYCDIIGRMVIENKNFKISISDMTYPSYLNTNYHNIMDFPGAYVKYSDSYSDNAGERMMLDGFRVLAGTNKYYQVFDNNGNRTWVDTNMLGGFGTGTLMGSGAAWRGSTFKSDQYFDNLFIYNDKGTLGVDAICTSSQQFLLSDADKNAGAILWHPNINNAVIPIYMTEYSHSNMLSRPYLYLFRLAKF